MHDEACCRMPGQSIDLLSAGDGFGGGAYMHASTLAHQRCNHGAQAE